jgi:flagellar hook-basal body complex protein FliE
MADMMGLIGNVNGLNIQSLTSNVLTSAVPKDSEALKKGGSFEEYLLNALSMVNDAQNKSSGIAEQLITDPDSVDIHDVTTAMAEAKMTLDIAQAVIDRMLTAWGEITTTR